MIRHEDFNKPVHVYVTDGEKRDWWRWLGLRKTPVRRLVFAGFITEARADARLQGPARLSLTLESAESRLYYRNLVTNYEQARLREALTE